MWEQSFNQDLQVSAAFGFDASTPYIRDAGEYTAKCQNKFSLTPKGDRIFYNCTSSDAQDGSLCAYNQQKGSCKDSVCTLPGIPMPLALALHQSAPQQLSIWPWHDVGK